VEKSGEGRKGREGGGGGRIKIVPANRVRAPCKPLKWGKRPETRGRHAVENAIKKGGSQSNLKFYQNPRGRQHCVCEEQFMRAGPRCSSRDQPSRLEAGIGQF